MLTARLPLPEPGMGPNFDSLGLPAVPQSGAAATGCGPERPVDHHCQVCPTCGNRLVGHRCKLVCANCGYYLSCADYY